MIDDDDDAATLQHTPERPTPSRTLPSPANSIHGAFPVFLPGDSQLPEWTGSSATDIGASASSDSHVYHSSTRLLGAHEGLLIDPGSVGNLAGDQWARAVTQQGKQTY